MQFEDRHEEQESKFMLDTVFNFVEQADGDGFWWRDCTLERGYPEGTQGYLMVWHDDETGQFTSHHTYHYPPNIQS